MDSLYFAQLFQTHTPNLLWSIPIGLPLLIFVYSSWIFLFIGFVSLVYCRIAKKSIDVALAFLLLALYFLPDSIALNLNLVNFQIFPGLALDPVHATLTLVLAVVAIILRNQKRLSNKYLAFSKVFTLVSVTMVALYVVMIFGLLGAKNDW